MSPAFILQAPLDKFSAKLPWNKDREELKNMKLQKKVVDVLSPQQRRQPDTIRAGHRQAIADRAACVSAIQSDTNCPNHARRCADLVRPPAAPVSQGGVFGVVAFWFLRVHSALVHPPPPPRDFLRLSSVVACLRQHDRIHHRAHPRVWEHPPDMPVLCCPGGLTKGRELWRHFICCRVEFSASCDHHLCSFF